MPPAIPMADVEWPVPRETGNAQLLCGYIAAALDKDAKTRGEGDLSYRTVQLHGGVIVESSNGNRFRIHAEQISGQE